MQILSIFTVVITELYALLRAHRTAPQKVEILCHVNYTSTNTTLKKKKNLTSWQTSQDWQFGSRRKGKALQPQVPAVGLMLFYVN